MDKEFLNHILVQIDVMQTGCGCFDGHEVVKEFEYMPEAEAIVGLLAGGAGAREAVERAFEPRFDAARLPLAEREEHLAVLAGELQAQQRLEVLRCARPVLQGGWLDSMAMSLLLWQADLMGTGCNIQEGMADEYSSEADEIAGLLASGMEFRAALEQVFDERFWEGCLQEERRSPGLRTLLDAVDSLTAATGAV